MAKKSRYRHFPGSVVFRGDKRVEKVRIHKLRYNNSSLEESDLDNHSQIVLSESEESSVDWYDVRGLHDTDLIKAFGENFDIHPLILDEVTDTRRRPKFKEYKKGIFVIARALSFNYLFKRVLLISLQKSEIEFKMQKAGLETQVLTIYAMLS